MNRINRLFRTKKKDILSVYFTAGFPALDDTCGIITCLADSGVDLIEIGFPFSDPLADGPVIQASNEKALENGMSLSLLFQQLASIRKHTDCALMLMGYLNPVLQFGMESFLEKATACGIDGIIIPDLPIIVYKEQYRQLFIRYGLTPTFLITPQTCRERIDEIDALSDSFIYMVTSDATTGPAGDFKNGQLDYFNSIKQLPLSNPVMAGFGIHNRKGFETVCQYVNGGIIGSSFIRAIATDGDLKNNIRQFIKMFKNDHPAHN